MAVKINAKAAEKSQKINSSLKSAATSALLRPIEMSVCVCGECEVRICIQLSVDAALE